MHTSILIKIFLVLLDLSSILGDDYYEILGVSRTADQKEIRRAFKKLAVIEHPDKNNESPDAQEKFIRLTRAYETLKDPASRKRYDIHGEEDLEIKSNKGTYHSWSYYANNFGIYDDDPRVVTLDEDDYVGSVIHSEKVWLVNFYSPMCIHCHHIAPIWKQIAEDLEGVARIGAVNCEDEWQLCRQAGIRSYPTLLHFPKNSKHGIPYTGEKTYSAIVNFILSKLEVDILEIKMPLGKLISRGRERTNRPILIFVCGAGRSCLTYRDRQKVAALFENTVDVGVYACKQEKCDDAISDDTGAIYLFPSSTNKWQVVRFENLEEVNILIERVLEELPEPRDLNAQDFHNIRKQLKKGDTDFGWLICFYIGRATELNLMLKRLPGVIKAVKLGKINCGRYSDVCGSLNINRYPMWGVLKPGGAFELNHGKNTINDIIKFSENSIRANNVWALSAEEVSRILEKRNGNEPWFLSWYAPCCPPCIQFLREIRKASLEFDRSIVRFGTIDCTVHSSICQRNNVQSYPTAELLNGTNIYKFSVQKTASNIVQFVNEARNPSVERLTAKNYDRISHRKGKFTWLVEYFAPWCGPCQRLAPEWIAVAKSLKLLPFVKVANVDCEMESNLCRSQGIRSYPTIRMYSSENEDLGSFTPYNGQRDSISILTWVAQYFPRKVRDIDPYHLLNEVLVDNKLWIIDFFAPWCEHCRRLKPEFAIVAQLMKKSIQFGQFNCDMYVSECARVGIRAYPTLIAYHPRHNGKQISAGFVINGTSVESIKRSILDFSSRFSHDEL